MPTDLMPKQACPSPQHILQIAPAASDDNDDDEAGLTEDGLGSTLTPAAASSPQRTPPHLRSPSPAHGFVISLVPYTHHAAVVQAAIEGKTHIVTTSYISPALHALDGAARAAGIVVLNKVGLHPGIDHHSAVKVIDGVHPKGGKVKEFHLQCGTLPAPDCADNPLGYKFSWYPCGGLLRAAVRHQELTSRILSLHIAAHENQMHIFLYLIPLRILCGHLPSDEFMHCFPILADIFAPFIAAIRTGDIAGFDRALEQREDSDAFLNRINDGDKHQHTAGGSSLMALDPDEGKPPLMTPSYPGFPSPLTVVPHLETSQTQVYEMRASALENVPEKEARPATDSQHRGGSHVAARWAHEKPSTASRFPAGSGSHSQPQDRTSDRRVSIPIPIVMSLANEASNPNSPLDLLTVSAAANRDALELPETLYSTPSPPLLSSPRLLPQFNSASVSVSLVPGLLASVSLVLPCNQSRPELLSRVLSSALLPTSRRVPYNSPRSLPRHVHMRTNRAASVRPAPCSGFRSPALSHSLSPTFTSRALRSAPPGLGMDWMDAPAADQSRSLHAAPPPPLSPIFHHHRPQALDTHLLRPFPLLRVPHRE
ncbi:Saccharopine dehydrogenase-domain-containing protein [Mycena olivaceomarginata]|nr:Saccharopine dehydrogenase-domain-containing protein [Mycena olivaceomarginata]